MLIKFTSGLLLFLLLPLVHSQGQPLGPAPVAGTPPAGDKLIRLENTDDDKEMEVVVENRFYRMVIKPSEGASAVSFVAKPSNTQLLLPDPKFGAGLMADVIREQGFGGEWQGPYEVAEMKPSAGGKGRVVFRRSGTGSDDLKRLTLTRTVEVSEASPVISVTVSLGFAVGGARHCPLRYWVQNRVVDKDRPTSYFMPATEGVLSFSVLPDKGEGQQHSVLNPPQSWMAAISAGGPGMAFCMDRGAPETLYTWHKRDVSTLEWGYAQQIIRHGQSWETGFIIFPFNGLARVDGVVEGKAGAILTEGEPAPGKPLRGRLVLAGEPGACDVELQWRRLPRPDWETLGRKPLQAQPGQVAEMPFEAPNAEPGTHVIRARLFRGDKLLGVIERPFVVGDASGRYSLLPGKPVTDQLGKTSREGAVKLSPGQPVLVKKILPLDCRLVRGFTHAPVDGRVDTRNAAGEPGEWSGRHGLPAVNYGTFNGNNGLHITLPEGSLDALLVRGGWRGRLYAGINSLTSPKSDAPALCEVAPQHGVFRKNFERPCSARKLSFFHAEGNSEPLADVSFLRVMPGKEFEGADGRVEFNIGGPAQPDKAIDQALYDRFGPVYRAHGLVKEAGKAVALGKGEFLHLITPPQDPARGIAAVGLELDIAGIEANAILTVRVQDALDPRRESMGVDFQAPGPGRYLLTLDTPDQVFMPPGEQWKRAPRLEGPFAPPALWISLAADSPMELKASGVILHTVPREKALAEAGSWRKFLLKGLFSCMSEPRPWMALEDKKPVREQIKDAGKYRVSLVELLENAEAALMLLPDDGIVRQYHDWIYQNMDRRKPSPPPSLPETPGAPEWAVMLRETWRELQFIPRWWMENRMTPDGELGGGINDDTDMFQAWQCLPMIESEPLGKALKEVAAQLSGLAMEHTLEDGINRRANDSLHAYEEGVNQLALCAWWFYGDPVHYERVMASARSSLKLMAETKDGRVHFGGDMLGIEVARKGFDKIDLTPGEFARLFLHPVYEAALYNRNPAALDKFRRWGETWANYQKPGAFVGQVDIPTGKPTQVTPSPVGRGPQVPVDEWLALYQVTGEDKWLQPVKMAMDTEGYWGFQASYGRAAHALVQWGEPYQGKIRSRFSGPGGGYAAFFLNKDRALLEQWLSDSASWYQRFRHMHTAAEPKTDRVSTLKASTPVACYLGDAPNRNTWVHYNAVSYEGLRGDDFAALVWDASATNLRVAIYNFSDKPLTGLARVWRLDHGMYTVRTGPDKDDNGEMDEAAEERRVELERFAPVSLALPPRQVTVAQAELVERMDDILDRADLAVSPLDTVLSADGSLEVKVHNIGAKPARNVRVVIERGGAKSAAADGLRGWRALLRRCLPGTRAQSAMETAIVPLVEAPLDLQPRIVSVRFKAARTGDVVMVDPDKTIPEIARHNNRLVLLAPAGVNNDN